MQIAPNMATYTQIHFQFKPFYYESPLRKYKLLLKVSMLFSLYSNNYFWKKSSCKPKIENRNNIVSLIFIGIYS